LGAGGGPAAQKKTYELATRQARGETEPVPVETGRLTGALARYKTMRRNPVKSLGYSAVEAAAAIKIPTLFVVAEQEELSDNKVAARVQRGLQQRGIPAELHVIPGVSHYGVYAEGFDEATRVELAWFDRYLKP
jgi:alpha-beta hydrolase superfamily lysophospholipase